MCGGEDPTDGSKQISSPPQECLGRYPIKDLGEDIPLKKLNIHPDPLTCVGEKTPWVKVNKYLHPLLDWGNRSQQRS